MKWLFIASAAALAAAAVAGSIAARRRNRPCKETDDMDGGVVKRFYADAPKVIESSEIVSFHCVISLLAAWETDGLGNRVYQLDAACEDGTVIVKYDWYDRHGGRDSAEYQPDADFMVRLQEIVSRYGFAKHNGYHHTVSGLPAMYGEKLDIVYASGERIYVYDNQSGFLPPEAEKALVLLFGAVTKSETKS